MVPPAQRAQILGLVSTAVRLVLEVMQIDIGSRTTPRHQTLSVIT